MTPTLREIATLPNLLQLTSAIEEIPFGLYTIQFLLLDNGSAVSIQ